MVVGGKGFLRLGLRTQGHKKPYYHLGFSPTNELLTRPNNGATQPGQKPSVVNRVVVGPFEVEEEGKRKGKGSV